MINLEDILFVVTPEAEPVSALLYKNILSLYPSFYCSLNLMFGFIK